MRRCFLFHQRMHTWNLSLLVLGLSLPCLFSLSLAQAPPITSSGLNTQVSGPIAVGGHTQYDITGGTRPNGGLNLFHSFGDFGVPTNSIANFQNTPVNGVLPTTSNILARVTGGDMSNIFGSIKTTDFGNANLFLMNPVGFLFGPNASVNVGGMVAFTSADYLKLTDNARFNAIPNAAADALLTALPVASFGFLGSNPGAITVKGSQFIAESISLVGGNISIESGTPAGGTAQSARLSAPNGNILLTSAASPGEFDAATFQPLPNMDGATFASSGSVHLGQNSIVDVSGTGTVSLRGGQFVLEVANSVLNTSANSSSGVDNIILNNGSTITLATTVPGNAGSVTVNGEKIVLLGNSSIMSAAEGDGSGGLVRLTAPSIEIHGNSNIEASTLGLGHAGNIELQGNLVNLTESSISARTQAEGRGGNITIRGLTGEGSRATDVSLFNSQLVSETIGDGVNTQGPAGNILVETARLNLSGGSLLNTASRGSTGDAGTITVNATDSLTISGRGTQLFSGSVEDSFGKAGIISISAPSVLIDSGGFFTETQGTGPGGNIEIVMSQTVTLTNGATVSASSTGQMQNPGPAGNINITATNGFTMQNSTVTTQAGLGVSGGNIKVTTAPSGTVLLENNSRISASATDGGTGGNISIDPQSVILQNSKILAQAAQGQGGTITITANLFLPDANSIVNADSGSGLNGTVTIQSPNAPASGKIQPLGNQPLQATSLLNQRCAALAGGEFSSFTVAGRDNLPTEPGSWLASPLAALSPGTGPGTKGSKGEKPVARGEGLEGMTLGASFAGKTASLSLRQITPAGFLTQAFAVDWSTDCQS